MKASLVIPTRNAGEAFAEVLAAIRLQPGELELVVVDSASTDGTPERAAAAGARVHGIDASEFNHGRTRNLGVALSTGEFVAFLSQDARPRDGAWLPELLSPFEDETVVGVYGRVVARSDASPLVRRSVEGDLVSGTARLRKRIDDPARWARTPPAEKRVYAHFNDVSSCVRRAAIERVSFPELSFGEDITWGLAMLEGGSTLVYAPGSVAVHSHESSLAADFARHRDDARLLALLFDLHPGPLQQLRVLAAELRADLAALGRGGWRSFVRYGAYSPLLRVAQALGRTVGSAQPASPADRAALEAWRGARLDAGRA